MGIYEEIDNPIRESYICVRDCGLLDRLEELGLPSIEDVSYMENSFNNRINLLFLEDKLMKCDNISHIVANNLMILYLSALGNRGYLVDDNGTFAVYDNIVCCEKPLLKRRYSSQNPRRCSNGMTLLQIVDEYDFLGVSYYTLCKRYDAGARTLKELLNPKGAK